jgi:hypothetical protein
MPISSRVLRSASPQFVKSASSLTEARFLNLRTVFLCHSHHDAELSKGLISLFASQFQLQMIPESGTAMNISNSTEKSIYLTQGI